MKIITRHLAYLSMEKECKIEERTLLNRRETYNQKCAFNDSV